MIKHMFALAAAASLAATPAAAAASATAATAASTLSVAQDSDTGSGGGFFNTPEATIGVGIFVLITVFGVLVAAGVFDDDEESISF